VGWELVLGDTVVASVSPGTYGDEETEYTFEQCLTEGCYTFVLTDEYGDGLNGAAWGQCGVDGFYTASDSSGMTLFQMDEADYGDEIQHEFCLPAIFGCTNPDACNFDAEANTDNGMCEVPGDSCDDGDETTVFDVIGEDCLCSGVPAVNGCTDEEACNYNELANVDDASCYYLGTGNITGPLFPFAGDTATYTYNGATGDAFSWTVSGGEILEGQGEAVVTIVWGNVAGGGSVSVVESDATGCEGEVVRTVQILETTSIWETPALELTLMPNPARDLVTLQFAESGYGPVEVVLFDVRGAKALHLTTSGQTVDVSSLSPGRYTLQATTSRGRVTLPLAVQ